MRIDFQRGVAALTLAAATLVAGCGGNVNTTPVTPAFSSFSSPEVNGSFATFVAGSGAPTGTTETVVASATAPNNVPAPSSVKRVESVAGAHGFLYVTVTFSNDVPASAITGINLTSSTVPAGASTFVELDDPAATPAKIVTIAGTATSTGASFTNPTPGLYGSLQTFAGNHPYVFQFYYVAVAPTPSPSPSPSPAPTPAGPIVLSPTSVSLNGVGSANAATVSVTETKYTGAFSSAGCSGIATIAASGSTLTVTGVSAGTCTASITDSFGQTMALPITVTTSGLSVN